MSERTEVRAFILSSFIPDAAPGELGDDDDLLANGIIDSLGLLNLVSWVEAHFGITIDDADLSPERFSSVDAVVGYVEQARASSSA